MGQGWFEYFLVIVISGYEIFTVMVMGLHSRYCYGGNFTYYVIVW